jgi:hypothetical protein
MQEDPTKNPTTPEPILRPEARVGNARADRSLAAMVLFVCTLGGMGIGFGSAMYLMRAHWGAPGAWRTAEMRVATEGMTWLGVGVLSLARHDGAVVTRVFEETAAERSGLAIGDVVRRFEGKPIRTNSDLVEAVRVRAPGDLVAIDIERDRTPMTVHARLGAR